MYIFDMLLKVCKVLKAVEMAGVVSVKALWVNF